MRIAFYSPRASHLDLELARGGDPIFLHDLFAALRSRGHDVKVVSRLDIRDVWRGRVGLRRLLAEVVRIRREMRRFRPDAWLVYDASRTYPDLVGWWPRPRRYVLLAAQAWQSKRLPRRWRWLFAAAHRLSLARATAVTALRPASVRGLRGLGVPSSRLWVLPPAVPIWDPVPERVAARRHLGLDEDARIALCISRLTDPADVKERKTEIVADLVGVVAALPDEIVLVVVGDGPGRPHIEREIERLGAHDRIRLVGSRPRDDVMWFLAACDVYAYPDKLDRPYLTILEAQMCGRPVVLMRSPSAETTVDDGRTGILTNDLNDFREALRELARDRDRAEAMGIAGREYVTRFHSIDARASQIEALLDGRPAALGRRWRADPSV